MHSRITSFLVSLLLILCESANAQQAKAPVTNKFPDGITVSELKRSKHLYVITSVPLKGGAIPYVRKDKDIFLYHFINTRFNIDSLLLLNEVSFVQPERIASEEMVVNGSDLSLNNISFAHIKYPGVTGRTLTASIKENRPDTADIDFRLRFFKTGTESQTLSGHATAMTTLIGGAGNTYYNGKGAAYKANLTSTSFQNLLPEHDSFYRKIRITVQNHSYGTAIENFYGADSYAYDASVNNNDSLLHVFSAGNSGNSTPTSGKYSGLVGFANLTGSFKHSKNSLSVGATDSFYNVDPLSSKGPSYDGRIKPELVAFGQDGSSGAAALVSGAALLVQDAYKQKYNSLPSSALVRATLINAADDILQPGPDYRSGFGSLNAERAIRQIANGQFFSGIATNGSTQQFNITVTTGIKELKLSLAWNDVAAMPNAAKALINTLDLELEEASTGHIHHPLVLSSFPHIDSLNAVAVEKKDTLNTVEQIVLLTPAAGNYIIRVKGTSIQNTQPFSIVYNSELEDDLYFTYPSRNDNLFTAGVNTIRWRSFTTATTGVLEISYDAGNAWELLSNNLSLSNRYNKALIKDTATTARLRITFASSTGSKSVLSDTFTITPRLQTKVVFNCVDSFLFNWSKLEGVSSYQIYGLTDSFMRPLYQATDTFIIVKPGSIKHFAVAPVVNTRTGVRSFTFDYTIQGVGCYINNLVADVVDDSVVNLKAILGASSQVQQVTFQRLYPLTNLITINVNQDTVAITDKPNAEGVIYYRVKIRLKNSNEVISDTVQVRIFRQQQFFVYPNPVRSGSKLVLQSKDYNNSIIIFYDVTGKQVFSHKLMSDNELITVPAIPKGIYFFQVLRSNHRIGTGKLIIQ
jgi:hypothetical protein